MQELEMAEKGFFNPKNPQKYKGNPKNIVFRSNWEAMLMRVFDSNPDVVEWCSEEVIIPYISPIDKCQHRYYPDFVVKTRHKDTGDIITRMIEVKPEKQTKPPKKPQKVTRNYKRDKITYEINLAKWKAAKAFCDKQGWLFEIFTEKQLGLK